MTECSAEQLVFFYFRQGALTVDFAGGQIPSYAGLLLIRQADDARGLSKGLADCIMERRDERHADHDPTTMPRQAAK